MSRRRFGVAAAAVLVAVATTARAQDCVTRPLLGRRMAAGADVSHSSGGETGFAASLTGRVIDRVRLTGAYQRTRLDEVDHLAHEARFTLSAPFTAAGLELCPSAGYGYRRLSTQQSTTDGRVSTREMFVGASLSRSFAMGRSSRLTPFIEPVLVRRNVTWESIDAWLVEGDDRRSQVDLWLGTSLTTSRGALIARFRAGNGSGFALGVVTGFGGR